MEAKGFVKDGGRAVLGLPKEPQPQQKLAKNEGNGVKASELVREKQLLAPRIF